MGIKHKINSMIQGLEVDFNQQELEHWMGWELTDEQWVFFVYQIKFSLEVITIIHHISVFNFCIHNLYFISCFCFEIQSILLELNR